MDKEIKKIRKSALRVKLLEYLDHPTSVSELTSEFKVNKTSIYRQLEVLLQNGTVKEIDFGDGKKRYERADLGHHHHLICDKCGFVSDITMNNDLEEIEKEIKNKKGFSVTRHSLEFFGTCKDCN